MGKTVRRRIAATGGRVVNHLRDQTQTAECLRAEPRRSQKRFKRWRLLFIGRDQHFLERRGIHIGRRDAVPPRHLQVRRLRSNWRLEKRQPLMVKKRLDFPQDALGMFAGRLRQRLPMTFRFPGHQVQGRRLRIARHRRVRLAHKAWHHVRKPVVPSGIAIVLVHPLLHHAPGLFSRNEEKAMVIELVAVLHRGGVDLRRELARADQKIGGLSGSLARLADVLRRLAASGALAAADCKSQVAAVFASGLLERAADGGRYAARMPIEAKHAAERLKPEGIAQTAQQFVRPGVADNEAADGAGHLHHAAKQPRRRRSSMQR